MNRILRLTGALTIIVVSIAVFLILLDNVVMPYLVDVERVRVPKLLGRTVPEAKTALRKRGLRLAHPDSVYSEAIMPGHIVEQTPKAGAKIKRARRVFVDVSRGQRLYTVPDVRELSLRDAKLRLVATQLRVGSFEYVSSSSIPEGPVISQHPSPRSRIPKGSGVNLRVSSGSPFADKRVPDLTGLPIEHAEDSLSTYEMLLGSIVNQVDNMSSPGTVLSQTPAPNVRAKRHTKIELVVSVAAPDTSDHPNARRLPR